MYDVLAPEMVTSTVYWPDPCSLRSRLASSLLEPPRYSTSTPNAFLNASGTLTRASGLGPVPSTSLPSFLAPAAQPCPGPRPPRSGNHDGSTHASPSFDAPPSPTVKYRDSTVQVSG